MKKKCNVQPYKDLFNLKSMKPRRRKSFEKRVGLISWAQDCLYCQTKGGRLGSSAQLSKVEKVKIKSEKCKGKIKSESGMRLSLLFSVFKSWRNGNEKCKEKNEKWKWRLSLLFTVVKSWKNEKWKWKWDCLYCQTKGGGKELCPAFKSWNGSMKSCQKLTRLTKRGIFRIVEKL